MLRAAVSSRQLFQPRLAHVSLESRSHLLFRSARFSSESAAQVVKPVKKKRRWLLYLVGGTGLTVGGISYKSFLEKNEAERTYKSKKEERLPPRSENLERLRSGEEFDILVVGGGATGAGVALEAQLRGLSVACVEQEDFGSGTSSKSTKLLWAGSRYLVKGFVKLLSSSTLSDPAGAISEFFGTWHMVMGCFRERTYMLTLNPHLTSWVPIAIPLDKWIIWPPPFDFPLAAVGPCTGIFVFFFKFYDALGKWAAPSSYVMTSAQAREEFPQLDGKRMKYVSVFYEGAHNDARTNLAIAMTAAMYGSCVVNYAKVKNIIFDSAGVARGAEIVDEANADSKPFQVKAKKVIYCGGPFTDDMRQLSEGKDVKPVVNGSGGTHIVLPPYYCPRHMGMCDMMTSRGSFLFFLPWQGYTLVGTTDVKADAELHHEVPEDEIQYLVNECEKYLSPSLRVRRRDVMSAWYGIRPLAVDPHAADQSSVSRDHIVSHHPTNGITFISGGKWTTWREMAEDGVDQVIDQNAEFKKKAWPSRSLRTPLIGAGQTETFPEGYHENLSVQLSQQYDLAFDVAEHLAHTYGTRATDVLGYVDAAAVKESRSGLFKHYPRMYEGAAATTGYPYLEAEVRYACAHEYAVSPADILARRTRLAFLNSTAAHLALPRVVEIMSDALGWSDAKRVEEHRKAEEVMFRDFAGPIPNKAGATLRAACTADVKDIFDKIDVKHRGAISTDGVAKVADELGFSLGAKELQAAMKEMDTDSSGLVNFPEFLAWWNSASTSSNEVQKKLFLGTRKTAKWATSEE